MINPASFESRAITLPPGVESVEQLRILQEATRIIRDQAAEHTYDPDALCKHLLLPVQDGYIHPFSEVYYKPVEESPEADAIADALGGIVGQDNFESFVSTLENSEGMHRALTAIKAGRKVAAIAAHYELFDTCAMEAGFLVAAARIDPEYLPLLIQRSRIIVGVMMAELALRTQDGEMSTLDALCNLGGVFKVFPDTPSTDENIKNGLDAKLVLSTNFIMAKEFIRQSKAGQIGVVALSPSGTVHLPSPRADGRGQEYVIPRASRGTAKLIQDYDLLPIALKLTPWLESRISELLPADRKRGLNEVISNILVPMCCELHPQEGIPTRHETESGKLD